MKSIDPKTQIKLPYIKDYRINANTKTLLEYLLELTNPGLILPINELKATFYDLGLTMNSLEGLKDILFRMNDFSIDIITLHHHLSKLKQYGYLLGQPK